MGFPGGNTTQRFLEPLEAVELAELVALVGGGLLWNGQHVHCKRVSALHGRSGTCNTHPFLHFHPGTLVVRMRLRGGGGRFLAGGLGNFITHVVI
jgi:hypothetical protein